MNFDNFGDYSEKVVDNFGAMPHTVRVGESLC